jgi:hypothetical protein
VTNLGEAAAASDNDAGEVFHFQTMEDPGEGNWRVKRRGGGGCSRCWWLTFAASADSARMHSASRPPRLLHVPCCCGQVLHATARGMPWLYPMAGGEGGCWMCGDQPSGAHHALPSLQECSWWPLLTLQSQLLCIHTGHCQEHLAQLMLLHAGPNPASLL